jgi:hypothetical protein
MNENSVWKRAFVPLAAGSGLIIGWLCCQQVCRRKFAEERLELQVNEMHNVLKDAHKRILELWKYFDPH